MGPDEDAAMAGLLRADVAAALDGDLEDPAVVLEQDAEACQWGVDEETDPELRRVPLRTITETEEAANDW